MGLLFSLLNSDPQQSVIDGLGFKCPKISQSRDKKAAQKKLAQLLSSNHITYCLLQSAPSLKSKALTPLPVSASDQLNLKNYRQFHNHVAQALISAYYLGASASNLYAIYERLTTTSQVTADDNNDHGLEEWAYDSPQEVTLIDWPDFLGDRRYVYGYYNFFREQIQDRSVAFEWKHSAQHFLVDQFYNAEDEDEEVADASDPIESREKGCLLDGVLSINGLGYGMTQLGYATETDNWELAAEALTLMTVEYDNSLFRNLISSYPLSQAQGSLQKTPTELLRDLHNDKRIPQLTLDATDPATYSQSLSQFAQSHESIIQEYTTGLDITLNNIDPTLHQLLATVLSLVSSKPGSYSPIFLNLLTCLHEIIEVISLASDYSSGSTNLTSVSSKNVVIPQKYLPLLLHNFWVLVVLTYISQGRPELQSDRDTDAAFAALDTLPTAHKSYNGWDSVFELLFGSTNNSSSIPDLVETGPDVYSVVRSLVFASQYLSASSTSTFSQDFYPKLAHSIMINIK